MSIKLPIKQTNIITAKTPELTPQLIKEILEATQKKRFPAPAPKPLAAK